MKKIIFIILCLLLCFSGYAQENWLCVYPNKKAYFEHYQKEVYCIRIDSTSNDGNILYPFSDLHQIDWECYSITSGSWLSKYILLNEDGSTIFVNGKNQQILIKNNGTLNEIWNVFENENIKVKGEITSIDLKSVLSVEDSVKTISFSVYNHNDEPINHYLNQTSIKISKHFGLLKTISFYYFAHTTFDGYPYYLSEFNLIGINEPQLGFQNINLKEQYYDFQVGDEFHILDIQGYQIPPPDENRIIIRYLSRVDYEDKIVYTYERKINSNIPKDTLLMEVVKGELLFNTEPNEYYVDGSMLHKVIIENTPLPKMSTYTNYNFMYNSDNDPCLDIIYVDGCFHSYDYFIGLGGPYYCCDYWYTIDCHKLVYYKKGNTEWGTPFSIPKYEKDYSFNIYPNPTTGDLIIENRAGIVCQARNDVQNIEIFDVYGRKVSSHHHITSSSNHLINISNLNSGIYFVKITTDTGEVVKKVIKQ